MTLEQRIEVLEKAISEINSRHKRKDVEAERVKAAMSHAARVSISELLAKQSK